MIRTLETRARHIRLSRALILVGLSAGLTAGVFSAPADDPVMDWNDIARELIVVPALTPVEQTRAMAIVQVAVHDTVSAFTGRYDQYKPGGRPPADRGSSSAQP